jgi:hypothetical protein
MGLVLLIGLVGWSTFSATGPAANVPAKLGPIPVGPVSRSTARPWPAIVARIDETIYLVSTSDQADTLQALLTAGASLGAQSGTAPPNDHIVVLSGIEQAETLLGVVDNLAVRDVRVVDLRAIVRGGAVPGNAPAATPPMETWYLVNSQAEADTLQVHINAERMNAEATLREQDTPVPDERILVAGAAETDLLIRGMTDISPGGVRLVDRRSGN